MTLSPPAPPPPRRHGCLWGCGLLALIIVLPFALAAAYGGWFLYEGFRRDPVLRAVSELVRHDGMAELALGRDIHVTGVEGNAFSFVAGLGSHSAYAVALAGSKGAGILSVEADSVHGHVHIDAMILTGPDGGRYDLLHHVAAPPNTPTTSI